MRAVVVCVLVALVGAAPSTDRDYELRQLKEKLRSIDFVLKGLHESLSALESEPQQKRGISAEEEEDPDFQAFFEGLSPEQQEVVKKFPSKWQQLKEAVHAPPGEEQEAGAERRALTGGLEAEEAEDADFKAFVDSLPPDQQEVVKRHPAAWKKLRAAVHTEPGVDVPAPEEAPAKREQAQPAEEEMPAALKRFYDGLSDDKKELLRRHPSQWSRISETLQNPGGQDPKDTDTPDKRVYESELKDFVSELSADDKQLLTKLKAKLKALREQVEAKRQRDKEPRELVTEGDFGEFLQGTPDKRDSTGWHSKPAECEGTECESQPAESPAPIQSSVDAAHEVKARFLGDMKYAREQGVGVKQLLQLLSRAKNKA